MKDSDLYRAQLLVHLALLAFFATLLLLLWMASAGAQDRLMSSRPQGFFGTGHAEHHPWYNRLKNAAGRSCCSQKDCRPTQARFNEQTQTWDVMIDGAWRTLKASEWPNVLTAEVLAAQSNPRPPGDFQAHVCTDPSGRLLYCFVPPASGG